MKGGLRFRSAGSRPHDGPTLLAICKSHLDRMDEAPEQHPLTLRLAKLHRLALLELWNLKEGDAGVSFWKLLKVMQTDP